MIDLLVSKESIRTLNHIAIASLDKGKTIIMKRGTANMRKRAMGEIRGVSGYKLV